MAQSSYNKRKQVNKNVRLPFIGSMSNRDYSSSKDQRFLNIYPETRKVDAIENTKIFMVKRFGLSSFRSYGSGEARGMAYFNNKIYTAIDSTVTEDDLVSTSSKITMSTSTGPVGFCLGNSSTLGDYLFVCDGTDAWYIDTSGTVTEILNDSLISIIVTAGGSGYTSAPTVSFSGGGGSGAAATAVLTSGVVTSVTITNAGSGYGTAPTVSFSGGDGTGASATAVLNAFPTPHVPSPTFIDGYILLATGSDVYNSVLDEPSQWESSNYLTAEMFPDPVLALARLNNQVAVFGTRSTEFFYDAANASASPLSRNDGTILQMGIAAPYAVYQGEKLMIYIGQSESGGRAVWLVDGFTPRRISDEYIDRILDAESNLATCYGYGIRVSGHLFFVVNLTTLDKTLVYDVDEKLWHEWSTNVASAHTMFAYNHMIDIRDGYAYLLHSTSGVLYKATPAIYQDDATSIITEIITNRYDMDTLNRKFMSNFRIVGDRYSSNSITMRWTDDDYQTWSDWKTISLSDDYPNFAKLGSFRRRAFNIKHTSNNPLRMESFEVTYVEGEH